MWKTLLRFCERLKWVHVWWAFFLKNLLYESELYDDSNSMSFLSVELAIPCPLRRFLRFLKDDDSSSLSLAPNGVSANIHKGVGRLI